MTSKYAISFGLCIFLNMILIIELIIFLLSFNTEFGYVIAFIFIPISFYDLGIGYIIGISRIIILLITIVSITDYNLLKKNFHEHKNLIITFIILNLINLI